MLKRHFAGAVLVLVSGGAGWAGTASAEEACVFDGSATADVCTDSYSTVDAIYPPYVYRYEDHETLTVKVGGEDAAVLHQTCYSETGGVYPFTGTEWEATVLGTTTPTIRDAGAISLPIFPGQTEPYFLYWQSPTCGQIHP